MLQKPPALTALLEGSGVVLDLLRHQPVGGKAQNQRDQQADNEHPGLESTAADIARRLPAKPDIPEMNNDQLLEIREVLVSLDQTAEYAIRNAEIATNLALNEESEHITIQ